MPELPEIESVVRLVKPRIVGACMSDVQIRQPKAANLPLAEMRRRCRQSVADVQRRAKHIVLEMAAGSVWLHLGLTADVAFLGENGKIEDCALGFAFDNGVSLVVRNTFMGRIDYLETEESRARWNEFGPEPLEKAFSLDVWRDILSKYPKQNVKTLLMDQALIAGIGNVYSDEILYGAHTHPLRKAGSLSDEESAQLHHAVKSVLAKALRDGGEIKWPGLGSSLGRYESLVHGRETCRHFGHSLEKIKVGSRTAYFCPEEQKL